MAQKSIGLLLFDVVIHCKFDEHVEGYGPNLLTPYSPCILSPQVITLHQPSLQKTFIHSCLLFVSVLGCPDLAAPGNAWAERKGNRLTIGCNNTHQVYKLHCKGTQWSGHLGNCSTGNSAPVGHTKKHALEIDVLRRPQLIWGSG